MNLARYSFGEWNKEENSNPVLEAISLCKKAETQRSAMAQYPMDRIYSVLNKMKKRWQNPKDPLRLKLLPALEKETGFSPQMIDLGLNELSSLLDPIILKKKISKELRGILPDQGPSYEPHTFTRLQWEPLGTLFHVLSGNVFLVGPSSWLEGVLTRNINILKMPSAEKVFLPAFIQSLQECDDDGILSHSVALVDFESTHTEVIQEFKNRVDALVVWGGEKAVQGYRNHLPARTKLIVFGPKLSFALITNQGLHVEGVKSTAIKIADEISLWDQNACTAPQACFVEGKENAKNLAQALSLELEKRSQSLPPGILEMDTAVEIQKWRTIYEIAEARGEGLCFSSNQNLNWTIVVDHKALQDNDHTPALEPSPLHRTIKIISYENVNFVFKGLAPLKGYLQSTGLLCERSEQHLLCQSLIYCGISRIVSLGLMGTGEIDDPHDGSYDLPQLMNLITLRLPHVDESESLDIRNSRLRTLIAQARKSVFYQKRLKGLKIDSIQDLDQIPVLTRNEMDSNMPPRGFDLATGNNHFVSGGGYVSRSGGTTGEPKFSVYDSDDWDAMITQAVPIFRALGIEKQDRLANCMLAGDLYGSFISFDHVNKLLGVTSFAFGGHVDPITFSEVNKKFKFTAIEGIPSVLVQLLREVKKIDPTFTLEKVIFAGSSMGQSDREWIQKELKVKRLSSVIGASDGGQLAFQCEKMEGALHHLVDDFNYIEILDDLNRPVEEGSPGKVVITSLLKLAYPLIRYEIGDYGRIVPGLCACGRTSRRYEILGRSDDTLNIGLMNLNYRDIKAALKEIAFSILQITVCNDSEGEILLLKMECEDQSKDNENRIRQTLLKSFPSIRKEVESHQISQIIIQLLPHGELPRNPRSGKVKEILDERK